MVNFALEGSTENEVVSPLIYIGKNVIRESRVRQTFSQKVDCVVKRYAITDHLSKYQKNPEW